MFRESREISYQVLWDTPVEDVYDNHLSLQNQISNHSRLGIPNQSPTKLYSEVCNHETKQEHAFDHSFDRAYDDIAHECFNRRLEKALPANQKIFVPIAWANIELLRLFCMYPSVMYCDSTSGTNKKARHLLTISGRTPSGKTFVFITAWIHNQRRSTFQWMFKSVLCSFVPSSTLSQIKLILVDGDPQQRGALETTIRNYFPDNVTQIGTCAWHLLSMGYKRKGPTERMIPDSKLHMYKIVKKKLLTWLYSFTRPGYVEDFEDCLDTGQNRAKSSGQRHCYAVTNMVEGECVYCRTLFLLLQTKASANILPGNHKSS